MVKTFRRNATVRYLGEDELAKGMLFRVLKKSYNSIMISFPVKFIDGSIHYQRMYKSIGDFELVEDSMI